MLRALFSVPVSHKFGKELQVCSLWNGESRTDLLLRARVKKRTSQAPSSLGLGCKH